MGINYFRRDDRDIKFVLFEHLNIKDLLFYDAYKDFDVDDFNMIIDEALKVCGEVLGPALQDGDQEGCTFEDGVVKVPSSFKECWKVMAENGWIALTTSPEYGGQGLPLALGGLMGEFFTGANMAFMTYPGLAVGNGRLIENFGTDEDRALFCEKMYTGIWGGTNYINSLDLVGRKLSLEGGKAFQDWLENVMKFAQENSGDDDFAPDFKILSKAAQATGDFPMRYLQYFQEGKMPLIALSATRFLECFSETFMAQLMLEQGLIARDKLQEIDPNSADGIFYRGKMETARFFCRNILTNVFSRHMAFQEEDTSALDIPEEAF